MGKRVLVIEDDTSLCAAVARIAARWGDEVLVAHSVAQALPYLARDPILVILDVKLPDGDGLQIVEEASRRRPVPTMVAISGRASPEESFRLAQAGVRAYLAKPLGAEELTRQVEAVLCKPPCLEPLAMAAVGHAPMRDVQTDVRRAMLEQALARAHGNRSEAARLLEVSRQAVQQMVQQRNGRTRRKPEAQDSD